MATAPSASSAGGQAAVGHHQAAHGDALLGQLGLALGAERRPGDAGPAGGGGLGGLGDGGDLDGAAVAPLGGLGQQRRPGPRRARAGHRGGDAGERHRLLGGADPAGQGDHVLGQVAGPQLEAHGHALELPVGGPPAHRGLGAGRRARPGRRPRPARRPSAPAALDDGVVVADGHHHDLDGGQLRRDAQPGVVAVAHDQAADHAGGDAPRGGPARAAGRRRRRGTGCRRPWRSSGRARGWCPSAGPCRRPSWPRRSWCWSPRRSAPWGSCARPRPGMASTSRMKSS